MAPFFPRCCFYQCINVSSAKCKPYLPHIKIILKLSAFELKLFFFQKENAINENAPISIIVIEAVNVHMLIKVALTAILMCYD